MSHHLLHNIIHFGRLLRAADIPVTPHQIGEFMEGLDYVDLECRADVKNTARITLVNRREHLALFDRAFDLFWRDWLRFKGTGGDSWPSVDRQERSREKQQLSQLMAGHNEADSDPESVVEHITLYSAVEILRQKSFAELTSTELDAIRRMMQEMTWDLGQRRTRRKTPAVRGSYMDWRRILRQNLRYGGEPMRLARRKPIYKRRPLVVICDVSGSMERYSRVLLHFIYTMSHGLDQIEAFVFGTRLTRITQQLRKRSVDQAMDEVAAQAHDMGGGTQIGASLKTFNNHWGRRVLGQGAIVLLISDGWDRGEPDEVRRQMERLQLNTRHLIWLNPLLGSPTYEPLTRGMQAALPFVDDFLPVHNLHSLEQLGTLLFRI